MALGTLLIAPPVSADEQDLKAKAFAPSAGKAAVYVYGVARACPVTIDGKRIGAIGKGHYYWLEVEPGEHEVWVGFDYGAGPHAHVTLIPIIAQAGQSYFVRVRTTFAHDKHVAVNMETGKAELLACCTLIAAEEKSSSVFR